MSEQIKIWYLTPEAAKENYRYKDNYIAEKVIVGTNFPAGLDEKKYRLAYQGDSLFLKEWLRAELTVCNNKRCELEDMLTALNKFHGCKWRDNYGSDNLRKT